MSTRCSIRWRDQAEDAPGFHLWDDAFDTLAEGDKAPVFLRLEGVQVHELETTSGGAILTVQLPREMALAMGLLPNTGNEPPAGSASITELGAMLDRAAFEAWFSSGGKWPLAVERSGDSYKLANAHAAWVAWKAAVAAERERICAAIKAADDKASEGDYMLDSDDCIKVARGEWHWPEQPNTTAETRQTAQKDTP